MLESRIELARALRRIGDLTGAEEHLRAVYQSRHDTLGATDASTLELMYELNDLQREAEKL